MNHRNRLQRGFTLIETLIYIALLALIMGSGVVTAFYIIDSSESEKTKLNAAAEAAFLMRKIDWVLDGTDAINIPTPSTTSVSLSVHKFGYAPGYFHVVDLASNQTRLSEGGSTPVALTGDRTSVTNLKFEHKAAAPPKPAAITFSFDLNGASYSATVYLQK